MRAGIVGTGAIAARHAQALRSSGFEVVACTNRTLEKGRAFAMRHGIEFVETVEELCRDVRVDIIDVCTLPACRLDPVLLSAQMGKHVLVEKPIATTVQAAEQMIDAADAGNIQLGVVFQHRFDNNVQILKKILEQGELGHILQADAYVKWFRHPQYFLRPGKGSWLVEGGGALITQGIHFIDLLQYLVGAISRVFGDWQIGGFHPFESEHAININTRFCNGTIGIVQVSTSSWPGFKGRIEIHGTEGTAVLVSGERLVVHRRASALEEYEETSTPGASLEALFIDFMAACKDRRPLRCSGRDGLRALQVVASTYESCRKGQAVELLG